MLEGLPPNNAAYLMQLVCDEATAKRVADIVVETFDPADTAAAAFEIETGETSSWTAKPWSVELYFGRQPDEANVRSLIATVASDEIAAQAEFRRAEQKDWVAASLEGLQAVREGRFVIHGSHGRSAVRACDVGIEIEAALAFGTGHHGTTRGCLRAIAAIARRRRPVRILDVGTGTGILAIAAARLFRRAVAAGDIDATAVKAAAGNARANGAGTFVVPVQAIGTRHPAIVQGAPYDLVFANILAKPLRKLAPEIRALVRPGGDVVLSGLLAPDVPSVLSAYRTQGFVLERRTMIEGWATLMVRRPVSSF